jgi:hypothetical protein
MIHVGLHSVGTYHKKFGRQNKKNKNILCRVFRDDTRQSRLCRVPTTWHSAKKTLCRVSTVGSRQRLTAVNFWTAADGPLPRAPFAECLTLDKGVFAEWGPVPSVQHSVKRLFAESLTLPRAALGKAVFSECLTKGTRQRGQHSAKPRIPVVDSTRTVLHCSSDSPTFAVDHCAKELLLRWCTGQFGGTPDSPVNYSRACLEKPESDKF